MLPDDVTLNTPEAVVVPIVMVDVTYPLSFVNCEMLWLLNVNCTFKPWAADTLMSVDDWTLCTAAVR